MGFDPEKYLIQLKGKDYLEVKWRLVWLREVDPLATIFTELIEHDKTTKWCMFKATISLSNGAVAVAHGQEDNIGFKDGYTEKAETKAIGRALAMLGFGTQFVGDEELGEATLADAPVDPKLRQNNKPPQKPTEPKIQADKKLAPQMTPKPHPDAQPLLVHGTGIQVLEKGNPVWIVGRIECVEVQAKNGTRGLKSVYPCPDHSGEKPVYFSMPLTDSIEQLRHKNEDGTWCTPNIDKE